MNVESQNVELHIEELVLHRFAPGDRHHIAEAMQQELTRLLAQGVPRSLANSQELGQLDGGSFEMVAGMPPAAIGIQVAQSIYTRLGGAEPHQLNGMGSDRARHQ